MKIKTIILLILLFIITNATIYWITKVNEHQRISIVLEDSLKRLQTHYNILLHSQNTTAQTVYLSTTTLENFIDIMKKANSADKKQKNIARRELKKLLSEKYQILKMKDILQYQFVLPNNESFLRMHKPSKFGDDLTEVRADFKYVNEFKKPIRGFVQGRVAHGFRNTFPIFDENHNYIGAMEISFSSDSFQNYLNDISNIHTHFLVNKEIIDTETWKRDDLILKYFPSAEHKQYKITLNSSTHTVEKCIEQNKIKLAPVIDEIDRGMQRGKPFSIFIKYEEHVDIVSFVPIKNLADDTAAWLVSYEENEFIALTLADGEKIRAISFFVLLLILYFVASRIKSTEKLKQEHNLLNEVLSTTEDVIFVTNFYEVGFSNKKFKELVNIEQSNENILEIFVVADGCLHKELLDENESFISLIRRTPENERIVSIIDKHLSTKIFKIDIVQINYKNYDDYLVTLTDITTMKERQLQTEKKAYYDGLTNIYNRYKFNEIIEYEIRNSQRYHRPLSMAILDIDKFKKFNDTYGHLVGDEVLIMLAKHVKNTLRETDVFARWGGEEFIILFRETDIHKAELVADKVRESISELKHKSAGHITASFGVTEFQDGDTLTTMFKRCDEALYRAKAAGRNRVEVL